MTNFGFIGLGGRGQSMLRELISVEGVKVTAVCDKYDDRANLGAEIVKEKTGETADVYLDYKDGDEDYEDLNKVNLLKRYSTLDHIPSYIFL